MHIHSRLEKGQDRSLNISYSLKSFIIIPGFHNRENNVSDILSFRILASKAMPLKQATIKKDGKSDPTRGYRLLKSPRTIHWHFLDVGNSIFSWPGPEQSELQIFPLPNLCRVDVEEAAMEGRRKWGSLNNNVLRGIQSIFLNKSQSTAQLRGLLTRK